MRVSTGFTLVWCLYEKNRHLLRAELVAADQPYVQGVTGEYELQKEFLGLLPSAFALDSRAMWRHADTRAIHVSLCEAEYVLRFDSRTASMIGALLYLEEFAGSKEGGKIVLGLPALAEVKADSERASTVWVEVLASPELEKLKMEVVSEAPSL